MTEALRQPEPPDSLRPAQRGRVVGIRTCVGCGGKAAQPALVRLKAEAGRVVVDRARTGGRGAWLHPEPACLDGALKRRAFARVLRSEGVLADASALRGELTENARKN